MNIMDHSSSKLISKHLYAAGNRDPISIVLEMGQKLDVKSSFAITPAIRPNKSFTCTVKFDGFQFTGEGTSKKEAKRNSAVNLIDHWKQLVAVGSPPQVTGDVDEREAAPVQGHNPIGALAEYCVKSRLKPPVYKTVREEGEPHCKKFTIEASIPGTDYSSTATSPRIKSSQKECAANILAVLLGTEGNDGSNSEASSISNSSSPIKLWENSYNLDMGDSPVSENKHAITRRLETKLNQVRPTFVECFTDQHKRDMDAFIGKHNCTFVDVMKPCSIAMVILKVIISKKRHVERNCQGDVVSSQDTQERSITTSREMLLLQGKVHTVVTHGMACSREEAKVDAYLAAKEHIVMAERMQNALKLLGDSALKHRSIVENAIALATDSV